MRVGDALAAMLGGLAEEIRRGYGPEKWCKRCGRKHGSRAPCHLVTAEREAKSGRTARRQVRP